MDSKNDIFYPGLLDKRSLIMKEFIKSYKSLTCLWDINEPSYKDKVKRIQSLKLLLQIYKKIDPRANICTVKSQINTLRSNFRRQLRKYQSMNIDCTVNIEPQQWKFQMLQFLNPYNSQNHEDTNTIECKYEAEEETTYPEIELNDPLTTQVEVTPEISIEETPNIIYDNSPRKLNGIKKETKSKRRSKINIMEVEKDDEGSAETKGGFYNFSSNLPDRILNEELKAIGTNVAFKLQRMDPSQRSYAELLINKVLIKGLNNSLSDDTELIDLIGST